MVGNDGKKKVGYVKDVEEGDEEGEYAFIVKSVSRPEKVKVSIGGVLLAMVIDSGSSTNVIYTNV